MGAGSSHGIQPVGLGARDTLRLEMGYALYGHELSDSICPSESVSAWTIKSTHPFIGRNAIEAISLSPVQRYQYGVVLADKGIARQGYGCISGGPKNWNCCVGNIFPLPPTSNRHRFCRYKITSG